MAGNKCDLLDGNDFCEKEPKEFAEEKGIFYILTSAAEKIGIEELFTEMGKKYLKLITDKKILVSRSNSRTTFGWSSKETSYSRLTKNRYSVDKRKDNKCC